MTYSFWLANRRDFFVTRIVKEFYQSFEQFNKIKNTYANQEVRYNELDIWVGTADKKGVLWELKDLCHLLWRDSDPVEKTSKFMFDWMIGAIFHEAMKLKENCYMKHRYEPLIKSIMALGSGSIKELDKDCELFFKDTVHDIENGMKRILCLFDRANHSLMDILKTERDNVFLIRFLLDYKLEEQESSLHMIDSSKILARLFPEGKVQAYCLAGESYLEGSWYTTARIAYEKALDEDPECIEAKRGLRTLEKRLKELAMMLEKEYKSYTTGQIK